MLHSKLDRAVRALVQSKFFWATIALKREITETDRVPTACTNGLEIAFNREAVERWTIEEVMGVLAHEVEHIARKHHLRRGGRDQKLWNWSCDAEINPGLVAEGFKLPAGAIVEPRFAGMSAEAIYAARMAEQREDPQGGGGAGDQDAGGQPGQDQGGGDDAGGQLPDMGGCGWCEDLPGAAGAAPSPADVKAASEDVDVMLAQAVALAKGRGELPGDMRRLVEQELYPKADGWELLRRYMLDLAKNDFSWIPPDRRMLHYGHVLPSMRSNEMGVLAVAIDISGSIDQRMLDLFGSCLQGVVEAIQPRRTLVYWWDSGVKRVDEFQAGEPIALEPADGGGGTRFQPVLDRIDEDGETPAALVVLTDCDLFDQPQDPGYPVVWARAADQATRTPTRRRLPDFGEIIDVGDPA